MAAYSRTNIASLTASCFSAFTWLSAKTQSASPGAVTVCALAVAARKRSPLLPDVPTSHEQGLPEFDCAPFYGVFAPAGTPPQVVEKLAEVLNKGLSEESVQKRFAELGGDIVEPGRRGPKALADLVKSESDRLMPILRAAMEK